MIKALSLLVACLLMSCVSGYTPPVSDSRAPASPPSVAVESSWVKQSRPEPYASADGRMFAVYTNATVGGVMYFEIVSTEHVEMFKFAKNACANLLDARGMRCTTRQAMFARSTGTRARVVRSPDSVRASFTSSAANRHGELIVRQMLGEKTRYMVCTGVWSLYGDAAERKEQSERSAERLRSWCQAYSGG